MADPNFNPYIGKNGDPGLLLSATDFLDCEEYISEVFKDKNQAGRACRRAGSVSLNR